MERCARSQSTRAELSQRCSVASRTLRPYLRCHLSAGVEAEFLSYAQSRPGHTFWETREPTTMTRPPSQQATSRPVAGGLARQPGPRRLVRSQSHAQCHQVMALRPLTPHPGLQGAVGSAGGVCAGGDGSKCHVGFCPRRGRGKAIEEGSS